MEIKAQLTNYTTTQRQDFIVTYNHNQGYEIKEYTTSETKQEEVENPETGIYTSSINLPSISITVDGKEVFTGAKEKFYAMQGGM